MNNRSLKQRNMGERMKLSWLSVLQLYWKLLYGVLLRASIVENYGQVSIEDKRNTISASVVCVRMLQYKTHTEV